MSTFMEKLRERVEAEVAPLRKYMGEDSPAVRMALTVLNVAQEVETELAQERVTTERAAEATGWSGATLQKYARAVLSNDAVPLLWAGLEVEDTKTGYIFVLGSIPKKNASAA